MDSKNNDTRLERVREIMKALNLTQVKLAKDIGVKQSHISRYLTGGIGVSDGFCYLLVLHYGINPKWLESGVGAMFLDVAEFTQNNGDVLCDEDLHIQMVEDLKSLRADNDTFRTIIADQRKRIEQLESQVKNNEYVVTRGNVSENV